MATVMRMKENTSGINSAASVCAVSERTTVSRHVSQSNVEPAAPRPTRGSLVELNMWACCDWMMEPGRFYIVNIVALLMFQCCILPNTKISSGVAKLMLDLLIILLCWCIDSIIIDSMQFGFS